MGATTVRASGGLTGFGYTVAYKDLDNDDPSNDNPSQLGYYRVSKRWDEVEPGVQINVSEFAYVDWDTATNRSRTTRTPRRGTDDPGVPPAVEVWEFNQEHELIAYEVTGQSSGASRDQVEKRRTEYQLCGQLPIRETTTITLGGYSRQEV
ncbi:MAG TPA: hypothetical protein GXX55_04270, partial [Firmicutes bacterium]|nr:hypothetical protein [Bacillota bacterium]